MRTATRRTLIATLVLAVLAPAPAAFQGTAQAAPVTGGCTEWRPNNPATPAAADCTLSDPWWTSYANCTITPIHSEPYPDATGNDAGLRGIPWVVAERAAPDGATIIGHQFFGNRPLAAGGQFPDGGSAKVLWRFDQLVSGFTMTATNLDDASLAPVAIGNTYPANTSSGSSNLWPSNVSIPSAGCWRVDLAATAADGTAVTGSVTFIVVE